MKKQNKIIAMRHNKVRKANEIIQRSRFSLSTQQQRIILYLISQITPFDDDFKLYDFSIFEFCKVCGIEQYSGKNYQDLKNAIKEIADKSMWLTLENGTHTLIRWIEKPYINDNSGIIQIRLDKDLKPYLLQLKRNYTQYELYWTLNFKSKYSIRLYELVKSIHYNELEIFEKQYSLEELRNLLDANKYTVYQDFKKRVLIPAMTEINKYSDKTIDFKPVKECRTVTAIRFIIVSKSAEQRAEVKSLIDTNLGGEQLTLFDVLEGSNW